MDRRRLLSAGALISGGLAGPPRSATPALPSLDGALQLTRIEAAKRNFPPEQRAITTVGYAEPGDGGGATYVRNERPSPFALLTPDGAGWDLTPDPRGVSVRAFGALGRGVSPAQNRRAIQAAIDYTLYWTGGRAARVYIPAGVYAIDDTIHLGYGHKGFHQIALEGDGGAYRGETSNGSTLVPTFSDRPCLNVQGGRRPSVRGLAFMGVNWEHVSRNALGDYGEGRRLDDTDLANWLGPDLSPTSDGRYTPYAAITIDAYAGRRPVQGYPAVLYPEWLGSDVPQYGKTFTSSPRIEDCWIGGFVVPIAIQPCDADGNGDFVSLSRLTCEHNVYGAVSVGNSQSRLLSATDCQFSRFHTGIVNAVHGRRSGRLNATWLNCSFESCVQWFDLPGAAYAGPLVFQTCYGEAVYRLGNWGANASTNSPLKISGCLVAFGGQNRARGVPTDVLAIGPGNAVTIESCTFTNFESVLLFSGDIRAYTFENCSVQPESRRAAHHEMLAHNFLGGGIMFSPSPGASRPARFSSKVQARYDVSLGRDTGAAEIGAQQTSERALNLCAWPLTCAPSGDPEGMLEIPNLWRQIEKSSLQMRLDGRLLTLSGIPDEQLRLAGVRGGLPGDVIYDTGDDAVYVIRSIRGGSLVAERQNGLRGNLDRKPLAAPSRTGVLLIGNARVFSPKYPIRATLTENSNRLSGAGRDDGYTGHIPAEVRPGDFVGVFSPYTDDWIDADGALVQSLEADAIVLSGKVRAGHSERRKRLPIFCRGA